jgi:hypothetical protein
MRTGKRMEQANIGASEERIEDERRIVRPEDIEFERIKSEEEDAESAPPDYQINTYPADFTLEVLYQKWLAGDIEIPKFQRQFVWKQNQASKLIESFLIGLPVPAVFLYTERLSQRFLVIDGQQRLRSVFYFLEGYFGEKKNGQRDVFSLTGLSEKSKYYRREFKELHPPDQRKFHNSVLRSFIVQQLNPDDNDTSMFHVFERLNTGGTLLANQEIRNCVYRGNFRELLQELNGLPDWRSILGREANDSRQRDIELILRFFALLDRAGYEKPMKDYLSRFMKANADLSPTVYEQFKRLFTDTSRAVRSTLGDRPFHIRRGLNSAVFDCIMVSFAHHLNVIPADARERYKGLLSDKEGFLPNVSAGTTDVDVVKARMDAANRGLFDQANP